MSGPAMKSEVDKLSVSIKGRVTMVGFRAFVAREAQALSLTGWVRNVKERPFFLKGAVDAHFEGEKEKLEAILAKCQKGPRGAGVKNIEVKWGKGKRVFGSFEVLR